MPGVRRYLKEKKSFASPPMDPGLFIGLPVPIGGLLHLSVHGAQHLAATKDAGGLDALSDF